MLPDDRSLGSVGLVGEGDLPEQMQRQRRDRSGGTHYKPPTLGRPIMPVRPNADLEVMTFYRELVA